MNKSNAIVGIWLGCALGVAAGASDIIFAYAVFATLLVLVIPTDGV